MGGALIFGDTFLPPCLSTPVVAVVSVYQVFQLCDNLRNLEWATKEVEFGNWNKGLSRTKGSREQQ